MESPPRLPPVPPSDIFLNVTSSFPPSAYSASANISANNTHLPASNDNGPQSHNHLPPVATAPTTPTGMAGTPHHTFETASGPFGEPMPPPPPIIPSPVFATPPPVAAPRSRSRSAHNRSRSPSRSRSRSRSSERSASESGDSEDEEPERPRHRWHPIDEDKSEPCADEAEYIQSRPEHSAQDHAYWEGKAFFDPKDSEIVPLASGRIDWLVEHFNGTKEAPNNELIMRSPIVNIGGYDWRIKFYPRGDDTHFLSVYLENVTIQSPELAEFEKFDPPAFPALAGVDVPLMKKRRSVAAQMAIIMYNPSEPRTYREEMDAHQFNKSKADYGWKYFTPRHDFHYRQHGERQAILRDDKLAFSAFIRVIHDPTGCMWQHEGESAYDNSIMTTSLRPFAFQLPHIAGIVPLLHFAPLRQLLMQHKRSTKMVHSLQTFLYQKLFKRECSPHYDQLVNSEPADAIAYLRQAARLLRKECDAGIITDMLGSFDSEHGAAIGCNRLDTVRCGSVQAAIDQHPTSLATPTLLTLELKRREFSEESRKWAKLTNRVELNAGIVVSGVAYRLFAFVTHCGDLQSNKHNVYVNPGGQGQLWFAYSHRRVTAMTAKQAVEGHCGFDQVETFKRHRRRDSPFSGMQDESEDEVVYAVLYVQEDAAQLAFSLPSQEIWHDIPRSVKEGTGFQENSDQENEEKLEEDLGVESQAGQTRLERERQRVLEDMADGSATPDWPLMDGDDVVMSDADEDEDTHHVSEMAASAILAKTAEPSSTHMHVTTIDTLGRDFYKGQMRGSQYHGEGQLITLAGDQYTGSFRDGKKEGFGRMICASNGNIYEGEWREGQHHGHGKLTEASTGNVFEGGWLEGKKHGDFILRGKVTEEDKGCCTICYINTMTTAFYDCGHVVACRECAAKVDNCPICRKRVLARLEIFGVKMSLE